MFDRNRAPSGRMTVSITMVDGETLHGSIAVAVSGKLEDAMNNPAHFVDFETTEGERMCLAKHAIRKVEMVAVPRTDQFTRRTVGDSFDPYAVLGVAQGSDAATLKDAYYARARDYHPDRFAAVEMPQEMKDYVTAMLKRINIAYRQLAG